MILFIAPNPHKIKEHEGYLQRVEAIDEVFSAEEKHYYDDFNSKDELAQCMVGADVIYVHSLYRAEEIIDSYETFGHKIITDLHGIAPEEEEYLGNPWRARHFNKIEETVFRHCHVFVAVTDAMSEHYEMKHRQAKSAEWVVLPIFDVTESAHKDDKAIESSVIYAGGAQKWQNVNLMVEAIRKKSDKYSFTIASHDKEAFNELGAEKNSAITIKSVSNKEVLDAYKKSSYGFILRDNSVVNQVSCPTKMIEYIGNGVVPIVLSPRIGDFEEMGYRYITLDKFLQSDISNKELLSERSANYEVYSILKKQTEDGIKKLTSAAERIKLQKKSNQDYETTLKALTVRSLEASILRSREEYMKNQIKTQIAMIEDYAKSVENLKKELADQNDKRVGAGRLLLDKIRPPKRT